MSTEKIARRLDALWPISDHTWVASGDAILNEWGVPVATVTDADSRDAVLDFITHAVGDLRWALGEIARLEAVATNLAALVTEEQLTFEQRAHVVHLRNSLLKPYAVCPLCHALEVSSVVEEGAS